MVWMIYCDILHLVIYFSHKKSLTKGVEVAIITPVAASEGNKA